MFINNNFLTKPSTRTLKTVRLVAFAMLNFATTHPVFQVRLRRALACKNTTDITFFKSMTKKQSSNYPGGSKSRVNKAGNNIRNGIASDEDMEVFETWRAAHRAVLNTFQAYFRMDIKRNAEYKMVMAQRHKRKNTIINKLDRFPKMLLSRMDDIAGCRLIFDDIESLDAYRTKLHKARFSHTLRNDVDKYDYIAHPKSSGYRGIHDIYEYCARAESTKKSNGLFLEIQYRTKVQHAWATASEVVGHVTKSQPKFQTGDKRYHKAMGYASEIMSRAFEGLLGPHPEMKTPELINKFRALDKELSLMRTLRGLNLANEIVTQNNSTILIFSLNNELEVRAFKSDESALRSLFQLEREFPEKDIVLVNARRGEDIRYAFKNYFSDAREFTDLMSRGITMLRRRKG